MELVQIEEYNLSIQNKKQIAELLGTCFPDYPTDKIFHRQMPQFRLLAYAGHDLLGQMSVVVRNIGLNNQSYPILGVSDFCVLPSQQKKGIATSLLSAVENIGKSNNFAFLLLIASNPSFYLKKGFISCRNLCRWVMLSNEKTMGIVERCLEPALMVKAIGSTSWPQEEKVDFMGHLF